MPSSDGMYPRRFLPETATPTTRETPEMLAQAIPVHRHGVSSSSFQSEKAEAPSESTADFRERRERPSEERENVQFRFVTNSRNRKNSILGVVGISMVVKCGELNLETAVEHGGVAVEVAEELAPGGFYDGSCRSDGWGSWGYL